MRYKINLLITITIILSSCSDKQEYYVGNRINNHHEIILIYVDEETEKQLGHFPIDREYYIHLLNSLKEFDTAAIILKFFFDEEKENDELLAEKISEFDNVFSQATTDLKPINIVPKNYLSQFYVDSNIKTKDIEQILVSPNNEIGKSLQGVGHVNTDFNRDILRGIPALLPMKDNKALPHLSIAIAKFLNFDIEYNDDFIDLQITEPRKTYKSLSFIDVMNNSTNINLDNCIVIVYVENEKTRNISTTYDKKLNSAELLAPISHQDLETKQASHAKIFI